MDGTRVMELALGAFVSPRTPAKIADLLQSRGLDGLAQHLESMAPTVRDRIVEKARTLRQGGWGATIRGDTDYPQAIKDLRPTAPILFHRGNLQLLHRPSVGMCGSRAASEASLRAAKACGAAVAATGNVVISGYAKGVDMATHIAALEQGGQTIIVLAEGCDHFRIKREFQPGMFNWNDVLVVSQFAPTQPWTAAGAMTRNGLIYGLPGTLVVVEAGERGGTLAAGLAALAKGRRVFVLQLDGETPLGNKLILERGGIPISSREELTAAVEAAGVDHVNYQLSLLDSPDGEDSSSSE